MTAGAGEARSVTALFLAAGAKPEEIDPAVNVLIEMVAGLPTPHTYEAVARQPIEALAEYRRRQSQPVVIDAATEEKTDERDHRAP
jgi:hypothetical protein